MTLSGESSRDCHRQSLRRVSSGGRVLGCGHCQARSWRRMVSASGTRMTRQRGRRRLNSSARGRVIERLTLGRVKVAGESNEITAVPELLHTLDLEGAVVTVDALNTQKEIAARIREKQADYVPALEGNHGGLHKGVAALFCAVKEERTYGYTIGTNRAIDKAHGRIEERTCWHVGVAPERFSEGGWWRDLRSVAMVEATREVGEEVSREVRYYLSSLAVNAEQLNDIVRGHWAMENSCHRILDVVFREDDCRVRAGNAAQNLALIRKLAPSMLSREKSCKRGVKVKRFKAALDLQYLLKILRN